MGQRPTRKVEVRRAEVQRWEEAQRAYRQHLDPLSLTLHPFDIATSLPQTSAQVASRLQAKSRASKSLQAS